MPFHNKNIQVLAWCHMPTILSTQETDAWGVDVRGQVGLQSKFQARLGYLAKCCLKI